MADENNAADETAAIESSDGETENEIAEDEPQLIRQAKSLTKMAARVALNTWFELEGDKKSKIPKPLLLSWRKAAVNLGRNIHDADRPILVTFGEHQHRTTDKFMAELLERLEEGTQLENVRLSFSHATHDFPSWFQLEKIDVCKLEVNFANFELVFKNCGVLVDKLTKLTLNWFPSPYQNKSEYSCFQLTAAAMKFFTSLRTVRFNDFVSYKYPNDNDDDFCNTIARFGAQVQKVIFYNDEFLIEKFRGMDEKTKEEFLCGVRLTDYEFPHRARLSTRRTDDGRAVLIVRDIIWDDSELMHLINNPSINGTLMSNLIAGALSLK